MRRPVLAVLLSLPAIAPVVAEPTGLPAAAAAQIFCISRLSQDMTAVKPLLSPELRASIATAQGESDRIAAAAPGEKPPLGDGVPWQGYPDAPASCEVTAVDAQPTFTAVTLTYGFKGDPAAGFSDTLVFVERPAGDHAVWRIDDVRYASGGTLREFLEAVADLP